MGCKFSNRRQRSNDLATILSEEVKQPNQFCCLGSIMHNSGEIEEDVTNRIKHVG